MSLTSDLNDIKTLQTGLKNNKVTRFAYTQNAYDANTVDGVSDYDAERGQNVPTDSPSVMKVNTTVVNKGYRARASSLTRMFLNHLFGRISYNLNKINDLFYSFLDSLITYIGNANGLATLDGDGHIPYSQLPESAVEYKGGWNASTNTPTLADGTGGNGDTYVVNVAGTQNLGSGNITFYVNDRVIYNGSVWQKFSSGTVKSVSEVQPDAVTGNVDLSTQTDLTKIFPSTFLSRLFLPLLGDVWAKATGSVTNLTFNDLAYGNGIVVGCTSTGGVYRSTDDGKSWSSATTSAVTSKTWKAVAFNNGLFHVSDCTTDSAGAYWSTDGNSWTLCANTTGVTNTYKAQYGQNKWSLGSTLLSSDGKTFTVTSGYGGIPYYADGDWIFNHREVTYSSGGNVYANLYHTSDINVAPTLLPIILKNPNYLNPSGTSITIIRRMAQGTEINVAVAVLGDIVGGIVVAIVKDANYYDSVYYSYPQGSGGSTASRTEVQTGTAYYLVACIQGSPDVVKSKVQNHYKRYSGSVPDTYTDTFILDSNGGNIVLNDDSKLFSVNGRVYLSTNSRLYVCEDFDTFEWYPLTAPNLEGVTVNNIKYDNGIYVITTDKGIFHSVDGYGFTKASTSALANVVFSALTKTPTTWVAGGVGQGAWYSNWELLTEFLGGN